MTQAKYTAAALDSAHVHALFIAGEYITCKSVVITTGTFLRGIIHVGSKTQAAGRMPSSASQVSRCLLPTTQATQRVYAVLYCTVLCCAVLYCTAFCNFTLHYCTFLLECTTHTDGAALAISHVTMCYVDAAAQGESRPNSERHLLFCFLPSVCFCQAWLMNVAMLLQALKTGA